MILSLLQYNFFYLFLLMLALHALADFPWQGDFLATQKSPTASPRYYPWEIALWNHSLIHALMVAIATGSVALGSMEMCFHLVIDHVKSRKWIGEWTDQFAHYLCKAGWAYIAYLAFTSSINLR